MVDNVSQIEARTELVRAQNIGVGLTLGGIQIGTLADFAKVADLLSRAGVAVPPHCRGQPGTCFALCLQAAEWRLPVLSVMNKSYVVNNKGVERIAYESQIIHAVIENNAPLKNRLRAEWVGEGDLRTCTVSGVFVGETKPHLYKSEPLGKLREARGRNESGVLKGSPMWEQQPDVQLFYSASRTWARMWCPDVIAGAYTPDELEDDSKLKDVTPVSDKVAAWSEKLKDARAASVGADRGFNVDEVVRSATSVIEGEANKQEVTNDDQGSGNEPVADAGRQDGAGDLGDDDRDQGGSGGAGESDRDVVGKPAQQEDPPAVKAEGRDQSKVFPPDRITSGPQPAPKPAPKTRR
jgi:RecT family